MNHPFINLCNIGLGFDLITTGPLTGAATPGGLLPGACTYSTSSLSAFAQTNSTLFPWSSAGANAGGLVQTPAGSISSMLICTLSTTLLTSLYWLVIMGEWWDVPVFVHMLAS